MAKPRRSRPGQVSSSSPEDDLLYALRDRRLTVGITQDELADLAGVSRSTVQKIESGTSTVGLNAVIAIADVLGYRLTPMTAAEARARHETRE